LPPAIVAFATVSATAAAFPTNDELGEILVGPDSVVWQRVSDVRLDLAMLYALLLQVAHPTVGAGVYDYSEFEREPWSRLLRTIDWVTLLVYGGADAVPAGRRLRELHKRFKGVRADGSRYHALEPDAYAWVHATLIEACAAGHSRFGHRMGGAELERFYREYRGLGRLAGIRDRDLPESWTGFREYFEAMVAEQLVWTEAVEQVMRAVNRAPPPPIRTARPLWPLIKIPASAAVRLGGVGLIPAELRARLGLRWTPLDATAFHALSAFTRGLDPVLPRRLKVTGPAQLEWRKPAIARGPLGGGGARPLGSSIGRPGAQWLTAAAASSDTNRSS
jgi:uncharacterized protein (DUF2236 family)